MPTDQEQQQQFEQLKHQWEQQHPGQQFDPQQVIQQLQQFEQMQQQQYSGLSAGDIRSQSQFDSAFSEQMFGDTAQREITQAYWQQAEETIRAARRVAEIYALSVMTNGLVQKIVPQVTRTVTPIVTQQVVQQIQQNPQLLKQAVQQASR